MRMRKKRHGSERLLALSSLLYPFSEGSWISLGTVFGNDAPLYLEVGCGKGEFITVLSGREPGNNYIAIEKISDVMVCAVEKYAGSRGLGGLAPNGGWLTPEGELYRDGAVWNIPPEKRGNVRFIACDAGDVLSAMPDNTLDGIMANFSDPWSRKCSYEKRRLTHPQFLEGYRRVMKSGALFSFKTDDEVLFDYTLEVLPENGFEITYSTRNLHESERAESNIVTEYERSFTEKGIKIKMLEACPIK